jgi:hypothetical protein
MAGKETPWRKAISSMNGLTHATHCRLNGGLRYVYLDTLNCFSDDNGPSSLPMYPSDEKSSCE